MIKQVTVGLFALATAGCATEIAGNIADVPPPTTTAKASPEEIMKRHEPHIITVDSKADFEQTLTQLKEAIDKRGFKTFASIDHAAGAQSINESLRPTTLVIFGNPKGGTPLMQAEQRLGLQLPLKILIAEKASGETSIVYPDMKHLFHEYGISNMSTQLQKIEGALGAITQEAAKNSAGE